MNFLTYFFYDKPKLPDKFYYLSLLKNVDNVNGFSIHGLWSNYGDGSYPSYCKKVDFDMKKLEPIETDLVLYWELPDEVNKLDIKFFKHEWEKHGSCMFQDMNEYEYFKKVLDLYKKVISEKIDIKKYKKGENYMIPFDLNFNMICV